MKQRLDPALFYPRLNYALRGKRIMLLGILICIVGGACAIYGLSQLLVTHIIGVPQQRIRMGIIACFTGYVLYWVGRIVHWYYWR